MDDEDFPIGPALIGVSGGVSGRRDAAASLAAESLDACSLDELAARIALLEAEIERVKAHRVKAGAHRAAAEALFSPRPGGTQTV
jgi:uncharacterized small protein (DUF1192 family)